MTAPGGQRVKPGRGRIRCRICEKVMPARYGQDRYRVSRHDFASSGGAAGLTAYWLCDHCFEAVDAAVEAGRKFRGES